MSYLIRVNGKRQSSGFARLHPAILAAETMPGPDVEVVDDGPDGERIVWRKKGDSHAEQKAQ